MKRPVLFVGLVTNFLQLNIQRYAILKGINLF